MNNYVLHNIEEVKGKIKNIIFDFGGVIFNIDYQKPIAEFKKLGFENFDLFYDKSAQVNLFDQLEMGLIDQSFFVNELKKTAPDLDVSSQEIIDAWNSILLDIPQPRVNLIHQLHKQYSTFLLSNTNEIHVKKFLDIVDKTMTNDYFMSAFDNVYFSNDLGMRKPNSNIFEKVLTIHQLNPNETLFIDDSIQHVEGAAKTGIYSYHLNTENEDILSLFASWK